MSRAKLPAEAFEHYVGLGPERSYQAVADRYGASKRAVTDLAKRKQWQERLRSIEQEARQRSEERLVENLEQMNERHLKTLQVVQRKALEALRRMDLGSAMEAVRALDICINKERLIRGEPSDRTELTMEHAIRKEYERWLQVNEVDGKESKEERENENGKTDETAADQQAGSLQGPGL